MLNALTVAPDGRDEPARLTVDGPERGENFIPWEQIEPLVKPGMTFRALGIAVVEAAGLSHDRYRIMSVTGGPANTLRHRIRDGLLIVSLSQREALLANHRARLTPDEVIA